MSKRLMFEKPLGMRDTLPFLYKQRDEIRNRLTKTLALWGYDFMDTPMLEYYETVGEASAILDQQLFKLLDQQGHSLVLRPDMTAPIARVAASRLKELSFPYRLAYAGPVFRSQQIEGGKPAQFEQVGIELIGDDSINGDAEVIALLIESLKTAGLKNFQLTIGHIGYVQALLDDILPKEVGEQFIQYLYRKDLVGFQKLMEAHALSDSQQKQLQALLGLKGNTNTILVKAKELADNDEGKKAITELEDLMALLKQYEVNEAISFDLSLVSHMNYYTGIVFEGYTPNLATHLCNGGRYDQLLPSFEVDASATGFAIHLDHLVEVLALEEDMNNSVAIIYDNRNFQDALKEARKVREKGQKVVLQHIKQVEDMDTFQTQFNQWINMTEEGRNR